MVDFVKRKGFKEVDRNTQYIYIDHRVVTQVHEARVKVDRQNIFLYSFSSVTQFLVPIYRRDCSLTVVVVLRL